MDQPPSHTTNTSKIKTVRRTGGLELLPGVGVAGRPLPTETRTRGRDAAGTPDPRINDGINEENGLRDNVPDIHAACTSFSLSRPAQSSAATTLYNYTLTAVLLGHDSEETHHTEESVLGPRVFRLFVINQLSLSDGEGNERRTNAILA